MGSRGRALFRASFPAIPSPDLVDCPNGLHAVITASKETPMARPSTGILLGMLAVLLLFASMADARVHRCFLYSAGTMQILPTLGGEECYTGFYGSNAAFNESGQLAGFSTTASGSRHAFLWSDGVMTDLGTLEGEYGESMATAINASGQVVGSTSWDSRAFLYDNGTMSDLGALNPGDESFASDINDSGVVVGFSEGTAWWSVAHAFRYASGVMTDLGTLLPDGSSVAEFISNSGKITGYATTETGDHAFLWDSGTMIDLGTLGGQSSYPKGINDNGDVVGSSSDASGAGHGFLYRGGTMINLTDLVGGTAVGSDAIAVNESGQVVFRVTTFDGTYGWHTYVYDAPNIVLIDGILEPDGISQNGSVVGIGPAGYVVNDGAISELPLGNEEDYTARGWGASRATINSKGDVVGTYHGIGCPNRPYPTCSVAAKTSLTIRNQDSDSGKSLTWKWSKGPAISLDQVYAASIDKALCLYDSNAGVPALRTSMWTSDVYRGWDSYDGKTFTYDGERGGDLNGISRIRIRTGGAGRASIHVRAEGPEFPMPVPHSTEQMFDQDPEVIFQMIGFSDCWSSAFGSASANDAVQFKARNP